MGADPPPGPAAPPLLMRAAPRLCRFAGIDLGAGFEPAPNAGGRPVAERAARSASGGPPRARCYRIAAGLGSGERGEERARGSHLPPGSAAAILPGQYAMRRGIAGRRRGIAGLRERMVRLEGLFEGFTRRAPDSPDRNAMNAATSTHTPPARHSGKPARR